MQAPGRGLAGRWHGEGGDDAAAHAGAVGAAQQADQEDGEETGFKHGPIVAAAEAWPGDVLPQWCVTKYAEGVRRRARRSAPQITLE